MIIVITIVIIIIRSHIFQEQVDFQMTLPLPHSNFDVPHTVQCQLRVWLFLNVILYRALKIIVEFKKIYSFNTSFSFFNSKTACHNASHEFSDKLRQLLTLTASQLPTLLAGISLPGMEGCLNVLHQNNVPFHSTGSFRKSSDTTEDRFQVVNTTNFKVIPFQVIPLWSLMYFASLLSHCTHGRLFKNLNKTDPATFLTQLKG